MDIENLSTRFKEDGYIYIENFFDGNLMDSYHQKILSHFKKDTEYKHDMAFIEKSDTDVIPWFPQLEGETIFNIVEDDQRLQKITEKILGSGWKSLYSMVMFSNKSSNGQAWHQDCNPENKEIYNLNRLVYTMDINKSTGGELVLIPGSHKKGIIPSDSFGNEIGHEVVIEPSKGSLAILHGHLWHKVLPIHDNIRVSTNYRCIPSGTPDNITDICVYRNMMYRFSDEKILTTRD